MNSPPSRGAPDGGPFAGEREVAARERAERAQALLAAIVDSADDAIIAKDLDGVIQSCNPAAERMFGFSQAELVGRPVLAIIPPDRTAEEEDILDRMRRGERVDHFETVRRRKDGSRIDVSLTVSPVRDASGRIIGASKIARDITARKRAAAELAAQHAWFRITLSSIGDAVIACDASGRVTFVNAAAERLTGWPESEGLGRELHEIFEIVNEKTRQPVDNPAALVMKLGHVVGLANHTLLIARDRTERPIADSAAPIRDAEGHLLGVVLVFRDVSQERRAEEALLEQREWLQRTLESIGDAVISTDVQGRIALMNPVAEYLTGWDAGAAIGHPYAEVFRTVDSDRQVADDPVSRVLAAGGTVGFGSASRLVARDGTERIIEQSGAPIRNRDGRIVGTVLVFRDVSERRRAELERQHALAQRERLLEAERVARGEAERASRIKDEFVAILSHELRTPLNAILGWIQLMSRRRHDPALLQRGIEIVERNTRLQAQLISDLLDISRIVSGKLQLDVQVVDVAAIVRDTIEAVRLEAESKGLALSVHVDEAAGTVTGDRARLQQVVANLLSNAIKFTPAGGRVDVSVRRQGTVVEFVVADTGTGIREEVLPQIFERFHQADRSVTRRFGGLGLGLAIVKHLVELHGGSVSADSAGEGLGATFRVVLPAGTPAFTPSARPSPSPLEWLAGTASLESLRLLVVEDEPDTGEFLRRLLESHGAVVVLAGSTDEALHALRSQRIDILISDIGLPDVDGLELIREVRRADSQQDRTMPAIALTAYARPEDRLHALRAGYQVHLAKPVESAELLTTLASFASIIRPQAQG